MRLAFPKQIAGVLLAGTSLLSLFSSAAHASWGTPTYTVANRQPTTMTDTTTPSGGGSACLGAACTGQVTAKFVWTPTANEVLPDEVYVLQYASAMWNKTGLGPPPMGMMSPSVQELSYSPRQRARVHRIQTAPGGTNPTANNGLGHTQVVVTQGFSTTGTSKGFKVVKASPTTSNGQTYVEVGPVTVGVTGMGTAPISPGWGYSAQIITPKMYRGTTGDITQPGTSGAKVMVGEQNIVSVGLGISAVGNETPPITYQWSHPGDAIKSYTETTAASGNPGPNSRVGLSSADLESSQLQFYWYKGGDLFGQDRGVSVVVNVAGTAITVTGKCRLYRPQMNSFVGTYKSPPAGKQSIRIDDNGNLTFAPGIKTDASVTAPNILNAAGKIYIIQVSHKNINKIKANINGVTKYYQDNYEGLNDKVALDTVGTDPVYGSDPNEFQPGESTYRDIAPGTTVSTGHTDRPGLIIQPAHTGFEFDQRYTSYLMYQPSSPNSIRTVLGTVSWNWSVKGSRTVTYTQINNVPAIVAGPWTLSDPFPQNTTDEAISPANVEATELPIWEKSFEDDNLVETGPW